MRVTLLVIIIFGLLAISRYGNVKSSSIVKDKEVLDIDTLMSDYDDFLTGIDYDMKERYHYSVDKKPQKTEMRDPGIQLYKKGDTGYVFITKKELPKFIEGKDGLSIESNDDPIYLDIDDPINYL